MANKARVKRVEEAFRRRIADFWANFTDYELKLLAGGDPITTRKAKALGGDGITAYEMALMTPAEREALNRIAEEMRLSDCENKSLG